MLLRGVVYLLRHWFLILVAVLVISPVGPHLLVWYTYTNYGTYKDMDDRIYLGGRGLVERNYGDCPVIVIIDKRTGR